MSIPVSSNFALGAALPLDARTIVADISGRNAIPSVERYDGLVVYEVDHQITWRLQGGILDANWVSLPGSLKSNTPTIAAYKKLWPNTITGTPVVGATLAQPAAGQLTTNQVDGNNPTISNGDHLYQTTAVVTGAVIGTPVVGATFAQATTGALITAGGLTNTQVKAGSTLHQATSNATATVTAIQCQSITGTSTIVLLLTSVVGTFDTSHVVTGTNPDTTTYTFTPPNTLFATTALVLSQTSLGGGNYRFVVGQVTGYLTTHAIVATNPDTTTYALTPSTTVNTTATVASFVQNGRSPTVFNLTAVQGAFQLTDDGVYLNTTDTTVTLYDFLLSDVKGGGVGTISAITTGGPGERFNLTGTSGIFNIIDTVTGTNPDTSTFTFVPKTPLMDAWPVANVVVTLPGISYDAGSSYNSIIPYRDGPIALLAALGQAQGPSGAVWITADNEWETSSGSIITPTFYWL